jgi:hypothetical protein
MVRFESLLESVIKNRTHITDDLDRELGSLAAFAQEEIEQSMQIATTKFVNEQGRQIAVNSDLYAAMQDVLGKQGYNNQQIHMYLFQEREL